MLVEKLNIFQPKNEFKRLGVKKENLKKNFLFWQSNGAKKNEKFNFSFGPFLNLCKNLGREGIRTLFQF
jgi:hypothetical protein